MVTNDDLIITNKIKQNSECAAPHGRLFQVLGMQNGRRVVKEIACNTVVVGGAISALKNLVGVTPTWEPQTINTIHSVTANSSNTPTLSLFGIGIGGSGLDFGSVITVDIKQDDVASAIPFRYGTDITGDESDKYFMRTLNKDGIGYSWYLKEFASTPVIKSCWKNSVSPDEDGTEILSDIAKSPNTDGIETFTEINIHMNTNDGREFFEKTGKIGEAHYNTFGFYTAAKGVGDDGSRPEYAGVRLYSVVNFNNRDLTIRNESTFIYRVYSLI